MLDDTETNNSDASAEPTVATRDCVGLSESGPLSEREASLMLLTSFHHDNKHVCHHSQVLPGNRGTSWDHVVDGKKMLYLLQKLAVIPILLIGSCSNNEAFKIPRNNTGADETGELDRRTT